MFFVIDVGRQRNNDFTLYKLSTSNHPPPTTHRAYIPNVCGVDVNNMLYIIYTVIFTHVSSITPQR